MNGQLDEYLHVTYVEIFYPVALESQLKNKELHSNVKFPTLTFDVIIFVNNQLGITKVGNILQSKKAFGRNDFVRLIWYMLWLNRLNIAV